MKKERLPTTEDVPFDSPEHYASYLKKYGFKGVGFSGGEPLLVFDKLLAYIEKIRAVCGRSVYLWVYTNGDLVTEEKLRRLERAGLDEIRFNISANDYDLRPVELAVDIIDTVTVEVPAIPEDHERMKKCLAKMEKIGVKHLNIHQLHTTKYNYKNHRDRGYTLLHYPYPPVFESEMAALRLIKYALDKKVGLPINYCSAMYKNRLQSKGKRDRKARWVMEDFEELTGAGYIRRLSVRDSAANIKKNAKILSGIKGSSRLWSWNGGRAELFVHGALLKRMDIGKSGLLVRYFEPRYEKDPGPGEPGCAVELNCTDKIHITKKLVAEYEISNEVTIKSFQKKFVEGREWNKVLKFFYGSHGRKTDASSETLRKEIGLLSVLKVWEDLGVGFPEVY